MFAQAEAAEENKNLDGEEKAEAKEAKGGKDSEEKDD